MAGQHGQGGHDGSAVQAVRSSENSGARLSNNGVHPDDQAVRILRVVSGVAASPEWKLSTVLQISDVGPRSSTKNVSMVWLIGHSADQEIRMCHHPAHYTPLRHPD